jgi:ParB/RepB/Spo0J family partition protein
MKHTTETVLTMDHIVNATLLRPSPTNPRRSSKPASLQELVDSIKQDGVLIPLLVRPTPGREPGTFAGTFDIADGHRRYEAAVKAGVAEIPIRARVMTDQEYAEIQIIANLQREDVHPLDEARGFSALLTAAESKWNTITGLVAVVAKRTGKEESYIARRLQLLALIPEATELFEENILTIDHALLLCRLPAQDQVDALHWTLAPGHTRNDKLEEAIAGARREVQEKQEPGYHDYWEPQSAKELKAHIENSMKLDLKRAPWDLEDVDLVPEAGACTTCPKQTGANSALFSDLAIAGATCTDGACYKQKQQAFVQLRIQEEQARSDKGFEPGPKVLKISYKPSMAAPRWEKDQRDKKPKLDQVFKIGQWEEAKKGSCMFVTPAVTVDSQNERRYAGEATGGKPGVRKLVCVEPKCAVHKKPYLKTRKGPGDGHGEDPWVRQRREQNAREARERPLAAKLVGLMLEEVHGVGPREIDLMLVSAFDGDIETYQNGAAGRKIREILELKPGAGDDQVKKKMIEMGSDTPLYGKVFALMAIGHHLEPNLHTPQNLTREREWLLKACKLFKVANPAAIIADHDAQMKAEASAAKKASTNKTVLPTNQAKKGACRHCGCTMTTPCSPPCAWADETETLCDAPACLKKAAAEKKQLKTKASKTAAGK